MRKVVEDCSLLSYRKKLLLVSDNILRVYTFSFGINISLDISSEIRKKTYICLYGSYDISVALVTALYYVPQCKDFLIINDQTCHNICFDLPNSISFDAKCPFLMRNYLIQGCIRKVIHKMAEVIKLLGH